MSLLRAHRLGLGGEGLTSDLKSARDEIGVGVAGSSVVNVEAIKPERV
jgi:hypothetical protein